MPGGFVVPHAPAAKLRGHSGQNHEQDSGDLSKRGVLLEHGPDCFITNKPWGVQLCEELELQGEMIGTTTEHRRSFIVRHGQLCPVPQGLYLMIPGSFWSFVASPMMSFK